MTPGTAVEPLITLLALEALLRAAPATALAAWSWAGVAALSMAALVATLPSSSLGVLLLAGAAGLRVLLAADQKRTGLALAGAFAAGGLVALPAAWTSPMTRAGRVVSFNLSLLQPVLLLACGLGLAVAALLSRARWVAALAGTAAGASVMLLWRSGRLALLSGSGFLATEGFVALIDESQGLGTLGPRFVLPFLSFPILLVPALLWWGIRRGDAELRVFSAVLAVTTVLALLQVRFGVLLAMPLAVMSGIAAATLIAWARERGRGPVAVTGVAMAAAVLLWPSVPFVMSAPAGLSAREPVWQALEWLRDHSEDPGDVCRPDSRPAWSVMAPWGFGHEVLVLGRRANVASPFVVPGETEGMADALRFFVSTSPQDADAILRGHEARWVLTVPMPDATLARYAHALGRDPAGIAPAMTAAVSLHDWNGSAGAAPGSEALVRVDLDVTGSGWRWFARTRTDEARRFALRVPYATDAPARGNVRVLGAAVRVNGRVAPVAIGEQAVQSGATISVPANP